LLLTTASQLRVPGLPVGPGEICLSIWILLMLFRETGRFGPPLTQPLSRLLIFWSVFAVAQSLGTLTALVIGDRHDPGLFLHDVMAYPLLAAVSCLSVVEPGAASRMNRVAWFMTTLGNVFLAFQLAVAWNFVPTSLIDPWYWERLRGWSQNPSQLALLCIVLLFVSLHLADVATRPGTRIAAAACTLLPICVGRLTQADTFTLVLVAAGPIFLAGKFRVWMVAAPRQMTPRVAAAWIVVLGMPILIVSAIPLGSVIAFQADGLVKGLAKNGGKQAGQETQLRLETWRNAIARGLEAGMLGLGPGPHLEIPQSLVAARRVEKEPDFIEHPEANSTPNFEAHNTLLDLFLQGGLLADVSFIWLVVASIRSTLRAGTAGLTTLLLGICIYGLFTLIIRHPICWFAISLCLLAESGTESKPQLPTTARSSLLHEGRREGIRLAGAGS
jgi:hypothetical protein